jgi:hypothetical protein
MTDTSCQNCGAKQPGYVRLLEECQQAQTAAHVNRKAFEVMTERCELLSAENEALRELVLDLRSYTHEWDWKYGEEWDEQIALLNAAKETEQ